MNYVEILEKHRLKLAKAEAQVISLERELDSTRRVVVGLRANLRIASETVEACQAVAIAEKRIPKISDAVRLWLIRLAKVEVFGPAEAEFISKASGEAINGPAVRQRITQLTQLGALVRQSRGQYSVDREICGNLFGVDWLVGGETDVEADARIARSHDAQIDLDNQIREDREAAYIRGLQEDRSSDATFELDLGVTDFGEGSPGSRHEDAPKQQPQSWDHKYDANYDEEVPF